MIRLLASLLCALALTSCSASEPRGPITMAASSLQLPLEQLADGWAEKGHDRPVISFASSAALARQIDSGSQADIFVSADAQWTNYIVTAGKLDAEAVKNIAGNKVVLATHREGSHAKLYEVMPTTAQILTGVTVATGDPDSVPLGRYAKEIMEAEGIWDDIEPRLIRTSSSSAALRLILLKEADFGFLYASDAKRRDDLIAYPTYEDGLHSKINYKALQLPSSGHPDAAGFLEYIASDEAAALFKDNGFTAP